jgi:hypothetical protein
MQSKKQVVSAVLETLPPCHPESETKDDRCLFKLILRFMHCWHVTLC